MTNKNEKKILNWANFFIRKIKRGVRLLIKFIFNNFDNSKDLKIVMLKNCYKIKGLRRNIYIDLEQ